MSNDTGNRQVSVTWKWLAVTLVGLIAGLFSLVTTLVAFDRMGVGEKLKHHDERLAQHDERMQILELKLALMPTREDLDKKNAEVLDRLNLLLQARGIKPPSTP